MKHIVAVIFEDGTEATVGDMQTIVQYIKTFRTQESIRAMAADTTIDWAAHGNAVDQQNAARLADNQRISAIKRAPRGRAKDVTPEKAKETLERIVADIGTSWEASRKAARELGISKRTLNRRIKKSAP